MCILFYSGTTDAVITPTYTYTVFQNNSGQCTFTCVGMGADLLWRLNGSLTTSDRMLVPNGSIISAKHFVSSIPSNNNTNISCEVLGYVNKMLISEISWVILYIQGVLCM